MPWPAGPGKDREYRLRRPIPEKFQYLFEGLPQEEREPRYIVTVDVADAKLLGAAWKKWGERADLAIDHHGAREVFAPLRWVEPDSAATAEMIFLLLEELGAPVDPATAGCVYTGIATDTGCFRYRNVTPRTHRIAARTLELGPTPGRSTGGCSRASPGPRWRPSAG